MPPTGVRHLAGWPTSGPGGWSAPSPLPKPSGPCRTRHRPNKAIRNRSAELSCYLQLTKSSAWADSRVSAEQKGSPQLGSTPRRLARLDLQVLLDLLDGFRSMHLASQCLQPLRVTQHGQLGLAQGLQPGQRIVLAPESAIELLHQ